eukprot:7772483-Prorocentrum_lima.AAC.1
MTSSLVGSEMCIRDRASKGASFHTAWPLSRGVAGTAAGSLTLGSSNSHSTVSYTHLTLPTICSV